MSRKKHRRQNRSGVDARSGGDVRSDATPGPEAIAAAPEIASPSNTPVETAESQQSLDFADRAEEAAPEVEAVDVASTNTTAVEPRATESRLHKAGDAEPSIGSRLRAAREAQGHSRADVSRLTRLPIGVIADIESDQLTRLGAPIYIRGYLRTYAKAVGVPEVVVNVAVDHLGEATPPALVVSHQTPRSTYLARRYGNALIYVVLTAVIVVPMVWLARQKMPDVQPKGLELLDVRDIAPPPAAVPVTPAPAPIEATADAIAAGPPAPAVGPSAPIEVVDAPLQPVMASMAPRSEPAALPLAQKVVLRLAQSSWIEFTGANGDRIEYALLPAGTVREYQVVGTADLRIGNTRGARLEIDGNSVDLAPHTRANVARISVGRPLNGG